MCILSPQNAIFTEGPPWKQDWADFGLVLRRIGWVLLWKPGNPVEERALKKSSIEQLRTEVKILALSRWKY